MTIHPAQQGSLSWMLARSGIPTASEFDALLTPEFKIRTGDMPKTYLARKLAEAWVGGPLPGAGVWDMDQGKILEEEAIPFYSLEYQEEIQQVGLCLTDDGRVGCSPDGLIGNDCGIEIKCPAVHTHVGYLLTGNVPKEYLAQVHGAMYVTGRPSWKFMSYCRKLPALLIHVDRDEEIIETINLAIQEFLARFDFGMQRLIDLNGGNRPKRRPIISSDERPKFSWETATPEQCDVIP